MRSEDDCFLAGKLWQTRQGLKSRGITLPTKVCIIKALVFPAVMHGGKEGRASKNWCFQTVVLEKTPENPLGSREIQPVDLKGNQPWILIGRTDAEAEAPLFWSPDANSQPTGKVPDAGRDWGQKEKRESEGEMAGWHHRCSGHELGQTLGRWWGTGRPGVLQSTGSQRVRRNWVTEQQQQQVTFERAVITEVGGCAFMGWGMRWRWRTPRECRLLRGLDGGADKMTPWRTSSSVQFYDMKEVWERPGREEAEKREKLMKLQKKEDHWWSPEQRDQEGTEPNTLWTLIAQMCVLPLKPH